MGKQKQVLIKMDEDFLAEIDAAFPRMGFSDRASFVRTAVYEELRRFGVKLPKQIKSAPSRAGKGGSPTHRKTVTYDFKNKEEGLVEAVDEGLTLPFLGEVAAGKKGGGEFQETCQVGKRYPAKHFVVRVSGASMEPELQDGDLIVVKGSDAYTPANGRVCVVSDGTGSWVKKWNRQAGLFESLNPDYADLEPTEDLVFQGYYVEKV